MITTSIARGRGGTDTCCLCSWLSCFCCGCGTGLSKSPTLTLPQAQLLVAAVLEEGRVTKHRALQIVQYYTKRNYVAWIAHREARLRQLRKQGRRLRQ